MSFCVGISSTFIEEAALDGVKTIIDNVRLRGGEVPFILSTREKGDNPKTDEILAELEQGKIPLIDVSAARHRKSGEKDWRETYGREVLGKLTPYLPVDFVFLFGDMTIWPKNMCYKLNGWNLHPALPDGPRGEWYNVNAEIIERGKREHGVMIHQVVPELDQGPVITYCRFPLDDLPWNTLPKGPNQLAELIKEQRRLKENPNHPLFTEIREEGSRREFHLIELTLAAFAEGKIRIDGKHVLDEFGQELEGGYDLTYEIEEIVRPISEGQSPARKEERF